MPAQGEGAHDVLTSQQPQAGRLDRVEDRMTIDASPTKSATLLQQTVEERGNIYRSANFTKWWS